MDGGRDGWIDGWVDGWGQRESEFVFEGDENNSQHLSMNIQVEGRQDERLLESSVRTS